MWRFDVSQEQESFMKSMLIDFEFFDWNMEEEKEPAAELSKRFSFAPAPNVWLKVITPENARRNQELAKAQGYTRPTLEQEFDEKQPFDLSIEEILGPVVDETVDRAIADVERVAQARYVTRSLEKSAGKHGHFRIQKNANGSQCAINCDGATIGCRIAGVPFTEEEISEMKSRCACHDCKAAA
jgi:hypothetical protein